MRSGAPNPFFACLLWQKIKTLVAQLADKNHSLIEDVDSKAVERFNRVIATKIIRRCNFFQCKQIVIQCTSKSERNKRKRRRNGTKTAQILFNLLCS